MIFHYFWVVFIIISAIFILLFTKFLEKLQYKRICISRLKIGNVKKYEKYGKLTCSAPLLIIIPNDSRVIVDIIRRVPYKINSTAVKLIFQPMTETTKQKSCNLRSEKVEFDLRRKRRNENSRGKSEKSVERESWRPETWHLPELTWKNTLKFVRYG